MSSQASSSTMSLSRLSTPFELDTDSFFDLGNDNLTSSATSPAIGKSTPTLSQRPSFQGSSSTSSFSSQQTFAGPSFQYDAYKQQTGLPVGGYANTLAVNGATGMHYMGYNSGFVMPTETLNVPLSTLDDSDFGRNSTFDMADMDFEADSPTDMPAMFYPSSSSSQTNFVNPTALLASDDSPVYPVPQHRMYPGVHSQQAAQAKAQQEQKQQEMLREQQQRRLQGQRSLPSQSKAPAQKDPVVEESISRLLSQMRQNSVTSTEDDDSTPTASGNSSGRHRKDEEDMDEDERLLASEEGKKLTSKERRQLRNKVSARAFRSRRKEYISQLEGEVNGHIDEISSLKAQNRQLMEENTRLTDLTRMLLSSPSFSGFLNELSSTGMPVPASTSTTQVQPQARPQPKDVNPHQVVRKLPSQNQQAQIGMTLIPETAIDYSMLDIPTNNWNAPLTSQNFQVFAVNEIPQGPTIDVLRLSGKSETSDYAPTSQAVKDEPTLPTINSVVTSKSPIVEVTVNPDVVLDEQEFALYFDSVPANTKPIASETIKPTAPGPLEKTITAYELVVGNENVPEDPMTRLERMCLALDATCERIALVTPHF